jgi:hypothetical protein
MSKRVASLLSVGMALAILAPLHPSLRGEHGDSFPFSWYPMFSRPRPDPERSVYVAGRDEQGRRHFIPSRFYARGTMNQARLQLQNLASRPATAKTLCDRVAERMAEQKARPWRDVVTVQVVRGWFDTQEYFARGNREPVREHVYAACPVARPSTDEPSARSDP